MYLKSINKHLKYDTIIPLGIGRADFDFYRFISTHISSSFMCKDGYQQ